MQTAVINFTTEEEIKQKAQKVAKRMGISLSMILNNYLKYFVKTKAVTFRADDEIPSEYLVQSIKKSEKNLKEGTTSPTFEDAKDAIKWLEDQGI